MAAKKTKKRWDKKDLAKKQAAKEPLALEAAAHPPTKPSPQYREGYRAYENDRDAAECPYQGEANYPKRSAWMEGWCDACNAMARKPAGNKGGTVTREAVRE